VRSLTLWQDSSREEAHAILAPTTRFTPQAGTWGLQGIVAAAKKAQSRDRVCRIADWAWEAVWAHCRRVFPGAPLWPDWNRWTVSDWHRETVGWE
jgi:hypothetical protein